MQSTPGVWDVLFYGQTTDNRPKRIVKFPSDINLSRHPRTKSEWDAFAGQGMYCAISLHDFLLMKA